MTWFFIALLAPILYTVSNYIDKYLIHKHFDNAGVGALMIYGIFVSGLMILPLILLLGIDVASFSYIRILVLIAVGILHTLGVLAYYYALKQEDTSLIVPLYQMIPVFSFVLGVTFLHEILSLSQLLGAVTIIVGVIIISINPDGKKKVLKYSILFLMILASLGEALGSFVFKIGAMDVVSFLAAIFWVYIGAVILGLLFYLFIPSYRGGFNSMIRKKNYTVLAVNAVNELVDQGANMAIRFAVLLAPLALVWTVSGLQSLFAFLAGLFLTKFFPKLIKEDTSKKILAHKFSAIIVILIGVFIFNS